MGAKLERFMTMSPDLVLPFITSAKKPDKRPEFYGVPCHTNGLRLFTFKAKGLTCVGCGLTATFFAVERAPQKDPGSQACYHLNLYAGVNGQDVLFTHDHILARGLGGKDVLANTQTMCEPCNAEKAKQEVNIINSRKGQENRAAAKAAGLPVPMSRKNKTKKTQAKRAAALAEHLKKGGVPAGKLCANRELADPEAEALRMNIVRGRLRGEIPGQVDISTRLLRRENISGAVYVKRLIETGKETDAGSDLANVGEDTSASSTGSPSAGA
jgi:hypothetical protein